MANRLSDETSPYLLQHANNPVNWYPWSDEALQRSKTEGRPIFLSIGYSACHWCHVMEHESFEDDKIAEILNEHFVCIKVDREERPDLDQIYMSAVQMLTGRGGWPMSVFLTPALEPFFGGTYWPPQERMGMPGFQQVLSAVIDAWDNRRDQAIQQAGQLAEKIREIGQLSKRSDTQPEELLRGAAAKLEQIFDFTHGGFGSAPKFPHSMNLQLLLRVWRRWPREGILQMVQLNLDKMFRGGIYDHLGGGFARYSVDDRWLVPHFEKMLYDNALLVDAYLDAYLVTGQQTYAQVVHETLAYILGYMTDELGGFHSAEDADSEGEEGKFYVWTADEITDILGAEAAEQFSYVYDVTETGNFEGKNILNLPKSIEQCATVKGWDASQLNQRLSQCHSQLLAVRDRRVRPGKDDKILASWNGLMIQSMARAAAVFQSERYLRAATGAANFIQERMTAKDGRLLHCWRDGQAKYNAYLDDYACLGNAYVSLYEAGLNESWIDHAVGMADTIMKRFRDRENDAFFYTSDDHERLIARNKDLQDGSVPSGNAMAATFLIRIGKLCGRADYLTAARETIASAAGLMEQSPTATGQMLIALDMDLGPLPEIVILGDKSADETQTVLSELHRRFIPNKVMACRLDSDCEDGSAELDPIFVGKQSLQPKPTVYVCEKFACQKPLRGKDEVLQLWSKLADGREDAPATVD